VRREHFEPAHQDVEQPLARRLLGHVGIAAGEHCAVCLPYLRGEDRERRRECAPQLGERDVGCCGDVGKPDSLERFFGEQRHKSVDDAIALGLAARSGPGG
jgi:hypothetical protein